MTRGTAPRGAGARSVDGLPLGYWPAELVQASLAATMVTETAPLPPDLSPAEHVTVGRLVAAGRILDDVFRDQLHDQALTARADLEALHEALGRGSRTRDLLELQELWQGPITTTLDNERRPFLPVHPQEPGRNLYPRGAERATIESYLADRPEERASILHPQTVVRSTTRASLRRDLAVLRRHPALAQLHPTLEPSWRALAAEPSAAPVYAVPYAIAWADQLTAAASELAAAGEAIATEDPDFAAFLRLRAHDLLAGGMEGGDAAWIGGRFGRLDAVIGPYEAYDDDLFGTKVFFGLRVLVRDERRSASVAQALGHLQAIEDALPIDRHAAVRTDIPIGVFDVVADFGQFRYGTAVAQILPNDPDLQRRYGRRILLAANLILAPGELARAERKWRAVMAPAHGADLTAEGFLQGTVWHEIGHYLGPTEQADGRLIKDRLADLADLLEELKADLMSAFALVRLARRGVVDERLAHDANATLLAESLLPVRPSVADTYAAARLVMTNGFLEHGVLVPSDGRLAIRYEALDGAIEAMLREVLALQSRGDRADAEAYVQRWSTWDERHESIAAAVGLVEGQRFHRIRNATLD